MCTVAEQYEHIVGIDTHARSHTYCLINARTGAALESAVFPTTPAGNSRAISWIFRRTQGSVLVAVEGTSSYGAAITIALLAEGFDVTEVRPPARSTHAHTGKSDLLDAHAAARSVMGLDPQSLTQPRRAGDRATLRVLLASRSLIDNQRTANRNALNALVRTVELGVDARKPLSDGQIRTIATWRIRRNVQSPNGAEAIRSEARRLATTIEAQTKLLKDNHRDLGELAEKLAPALQDVPGVGPVTEAIMICAYSHHGRVRS